MKLAFLLYRFFPFGGMQRNMLAIAQACLERGHRIQVLCHQWQGATPAGLEVVCLPARGFTNSGRMRSFYRAAADYLKAQPGQLVVGFNKFPGLDAYYAADSCFAAKAYGDRGRLYRLLPRTRHYLAYEAAVFGALSPTQILEVSPLERAQFQRYYGTADSRFHPLPPGIAKNRRPGPDAAAQRQASRQALGVDGDTIVGLAVGSGFKTKGLERSIRLMAAWRHTSTQPAVLWVVGQDHASRFRRLARQLGVADRVHFLGGRDDIPALLQGADVLLHPAYRENTGNVLLEAMIAGRPVIASGVCGYAHYIVEAAMGEVLTGGFQLTDYLAAFSRVAAAPLTQWQERGDAFARREEIYSRPEYVASLLETFVNSSPLAPEPVL